MNRTYKPLITNKISFLSTPTESSIDESFTSDDSFIYSSSFTSAMSTDLSGTSLESLVSPAFPVHWTSSHRTPVAGVIPQNSKSSKRFFPSPPATFTPVNRRYINIDVKFNSYDDLLFDDTSSSTVSIPEVNYSAGDRLPPSDKRVFINSISGLNELLNSIKLMEKKDLTPDDDQSIESESLGDDAEFQKFMRREDEVEVLKIPNISIELHTENKTSGVKAALKSKWSKCKSYFLKDTKQPGPCSPDSGVSSSRYSNPIETVRVPDVRFAEELQIFPVTPQNHRRWNKSTKMQSQSNTARRSEHQDRNHFTELEDPLQKMQKSYPTPKTLLTPSLGNVGPRVPIRSVFSADRAWQTGQSNDHSCTSLLARNWRHGIVDNNTISSHVKRQLEKRIEVLWSGEEALYKPAELAMMNPFHRERILFNRQKNLMDKPTARKFVRQFANARIEQSKDEVIKIAYQVLKTMYDDVLAHDFVYLAMCERRTDFTRLEYLMLLNEEPF